MSSQEWRKRRKEMSLTSVASSLDSIVNGSANMQRDSLEDIANDWMMGILKLITVSVIYICSLASIHKSSDDMFIDNVLTVCQRAEVLCIQIRYWYPPEFRLFFSPSFTRCSAERIG